MTQSAEIFDAEVLRAIFTTRVIEDFPCGIIEPDSGAEVVIPRYLESRSLADFQNSNRLTAALRRTAEILAFEDCIHNQHTWEKNIRALSQAATIHCGPKMVLRLLKLKEDGNSAQNEDEIVKSVLNVESERHVFVGAAYTGNIVKIREMLASSRDAQRESKFFGHPLQCACSGGHKDIVVQLLEHGADISHGKTSLRDAPMEFHPWYLGSSLQSACLAGHEDIVRLLLEPKYEIRIYQSEFRIAALQAARGGHLNILMLLLEEATPGTIRMEFLLSEASKCGQLHVVRTILEDKHSKDPYLPYALCRSLYKAASRGYHEIVRLLLTQSATVEYGDLWRPFYAASRHGHERVVRLIFEHGAETNGWPDILMPAASKGQAHIVTFLLESQADPNLEGGSVEAADALKLAKHFGYESVVRILTNHGVRKDETSDGTTPRFCRGSSCWRGLLDGGEEHREMRSGLLLRFVPAERLEN